MKKILNEDQKNKGRSTSHKITSLAMMEECYIMMQSDINVNDIESNWYTLDKLIEGFSDITYQYIMDICGNEDNRNEGKGTFLYVE